MATKEETFKDKVVTYFKGVKTEFFNIIWPEKKQVRNETFVVLAIVIFFTLIVMGFDAILMQNLTFKLVAMALILFTLWKFKF